MVRSPKSIAGAVGTTLGNAPYNIAIALAPTTWPFNNMMTTKMEH